MVTYRDYRSGDASAMHALDCVCFDRRFRFSLRAMHKFAEEPAAIVWIAELEGQIAGFVIAQPETEGVYLVTLDVAPEQRRQGIAGALVEYVEGKATAIGQPVLLHVYTENAVAIAFYERRGYKRLGGIPAFYGRGLDASLYRRPLL